MNPERRRELRVGLFVALALVLLSALVVVLGDEQNLFTPKARYTVHFRDVSGLRAGSSVHLNGVQVGRIESIVLPTDTGERLLEVRIAIDRRYTQRVRLDSLARIKTLGLLGDKFLEITSGSPTSVEVPIHGEIRAAEATNVDRLVASGEDVMDNIVTISHSLDAILARAERGEGVLGQLLRTPASGANVGDEAVATLRSVRQAADEIASGKGALHRLTSDRALADRLASAVERLDRVLAKTEAGDGLVPALLDDRHLRERFDNTLARLSQAADDLAATTAALRQGDALLPRMVHDEAWGREVTDELRLLVRTLREVAEKLDRGDGTAARLINDPSVAEALDDILVGVNESHLLRWLVRNRQKAGIAHRFAAAQAAPEPAAPESTPTPAVATPAPDGSLR